ncbi:hypothetical protein NDU88_003302 [Pleurodeles waltl]|uniref:Uncharacterized protein n=1 Tax=Pleurodeles waltl TaxID=8319 RepID=A0AAV7UZM9_PLEWA|nr:hypothetical protein NDU88_003302 [Pleurodeles waltl]
MTDPSATQRSDPDPDRHTTDPSATQQSKPDPDQHTATPEKNAYRVIGKPDGRVPFDSPEGGGDSSSRVEEEGRVGTGNPDIRVDEMVKRVERFCAQRARKEEEDAKRADRGEERTENANREGDGENSGRPFGRATSRNT